jgi:hypothetical protein
LRGICPAAVSNAELLTAVPVVAAAAGADELAATRDDELALLDAAVDAIPDDTEVDASPDEAAVDADPVDAELVPGADDDALDAVAAVFGPPHAARRDRMPPVVSSAPKRMTWRRLTRDARGCKVIADRLPIAYIALGNRLLDTSGSRYI